MRAVARLALLLLAGCSAAGPARPEADRALRLDVYARCDGRDLAPEASPDALCDDRECAFERPFGDGRVFAFILPWLPGLRGAQGNGPILLYRRTGARWDFVQEVSGCAYDLTADRDAPRLVTYWHMSAYEAAVAEYRWAGGTFVASGPPALREWRGAGD